MSEPRGPGCGHRLPLMKDYFKEWDPSKVSRAGETAAPPLAWGGPGSRRSGG